MSLLMPEVKHIYQNHHLDSTRWDDYIPRNDDIIIAPSPVQRGSYGGGMMFRE